MSSSIVFGNFIRGLRLLRDTAHYIMFLRFRRCHHNIIEAMVITSICAKGGRNGLGRDNADNC